MTAKKTTKRMDKARQRWSSSVLKCHRSRWSVTLFSLERQKERHVPAESASPANAQDLTAEIAVVALDSAPSTLIGHRAERQPLRTSASGCFFQNKQWEFDVISICFHKREREKKIFATEFNFKSLIWVKNMQLIKRCKACYATETKVWL